MQFYSGAFMVRLPILISVGLLMASCGWAENIKARQAYREAGAQYQQCLATAPDVKTCERYRLHVDAAERMTVDPLVRQNRQDELTVRPR